MESTALALPRASRFWEQSMGRIFAVVSKRQSVRATDSSVPKLALDCRFRRFSVAASITRIELQKDPSQGQIVLSG
jgi:hypothetical protein